MSVLKYKDNSNIQTSQRHQTSTMKQLETMYLMNVVLYFRNKKDVISFQMINTKCKESCHQLKTHPNLGCSFMETIKLFPRINTIHDDLSVIQRIDLRKCHISRVNCWRGTVHYLKQIPKEIRPLIVCMKCYCDNEVELKEFEHLTKLSVDFSFVRWRKSAFLNNLRCLMYLKYVELKGINAKYLEYLVVNKVLENINYKVKATIIIEDNEIAEDLIKVIPEQIQIVMNRIINKNKLSKRVFYSFKDKEVEINEGMIDKIKELTKTYPITQLKINKITNKCDLTQLQDIQTLTIETRTAYEILEVVYFPKNVENLYVNCKIEIINLTNTLVKNVQIDSCGYLFLPPTTSFVKINHFNGSYSSLIECDNVLDELIILNNDFNVYVRGMWSYERKIDCKKLVAPYNFVVQYNGFASNYKKLTDLKLTTLIQPPPNRNYGYLTSYNFPTTLTSLEIDSLSHKIENLRHIPLKRLIIHNTPYTISLTIPTTLTHLKINTKFITITNISDYVYN